MAKTTEIQAAHPIDANFFSHETKGTQKVRTLLKTDTQNWFFRDQMVRSLVLDGRAFFVLADVSDALEYRTANDLSRNLDEDEIIKCTVQTAGGPQEALAVSQSGLYHAIFSSQKPVARMFRRWVTEEVLPAIMRQGYYATGAAAALPASETRRLADLRLECNRYVIENIKEIGAKKLLPKRAITEIAGWEAGKNSLASFRSEAERTKFFFAETCQIVTAGNVPAKTLYDLYGKWCDGIFASERVFAKNICGINNRLIDYREKMVDGEWTWVFAGIALKEGLLPKSEPE